ncbi:MAG: hypothetical protein HY916_09270 [Desulfovibrio sp.]|jgi:hypothetical protein|nr:hypothetical protein [Desulfovibrio sp.]
MIVTNEPFILRTDAAAAKYVTDIKGWVSSNSRFFGDGPHAEDMARYDGCTHVPCGRCGLPTPKGYTACDACREIAEVERHATRERRQWDGTSMIYSEADDKWFRDLEEILDHCEEHGVTPESLRLLLCKPVYARPIDPVDHYVDDLPEEADEGDLPAELQEAFDALNKAIEGCRVPLSWQASKYALDLECFANQPAQGGEAQA